MSWADFVTIVYQKDLRDKVCQLHGMAAGGLDHLPFRLWKVIRDDYLTGGAR